MTDPSAYINGLLAIAAFVMALGLGFTLWKQVKAKDLPWWRNEPLHLTFALWLHSLGAVPIFLATMFKERTDVLLIALWVGWSLWLIAKTIVIKVAGRLQLAICLYLLWSLWFVAYRVQLGA